jgi:hypothetical protein
MGNAAVAEAVRDAAQGIERQELDEHRGGEHPHVRGVAEPEVAEPVDAEEGTTHRHGPLNARVQQNESAEVRLRGKVLPGRRLGRFPRLVHQPPDLTRGGVQEGGVGMEIMVRDSRHDG